LDGPKQKSQTPINIYTTPHNTTPQTKQYNLGGGGREVRQQKERKEYVRW
jgi:hypothetical protein